VTQFGGLFTSMYDVVNDVLVPAGGLTPLAIVAWFGFLGPILLFIIGFIKRLAGSRGKA
jgi:hypothetical protein